jgi:hypothetical protein
MYIEMSGNTPLARACRDRNSTFNEIRRLIDADPEAVTKRGSHGITPLHLALYNHRDSPEILHYLLDRCPPEFLVLRYRSVSPPLHYACSQCGGVSIEIIRRMLFMYPKALQMRNFNGSTPLHCACCSRFASLELIQLLASECPIVCLLTNSDGKTPFREAARGVRKPAAILYFLLEAQVQAAIALVVFADMALTIITIPRAVKRVIPTFAQQGFSVSYMSNNQALRGVLASPGPGSVNSLLNNNDLQEMLKGEDYPDVVCGMHRMIKASGRINSEIQLESKHHISILESVSDTPDCFYIHLRNNPSLCCRTPTIRVTHPTVSPVHVVVPTNSANERASVDQETSYEESGRKRKASD